MPVTMAPMCCFTLVMVRVWAGACMTVLMAYPSWKACWSMNKASVILSKSVAVGRGVSAGDGRAKVAASVGDARRRTCMNDSAPHGQRFKQIPVENLTADQRALYDAIKSGPRSAVKNS